MLRYVIKSFIINAECLVVVLYKLMNGEHRIVRLEDDIRYLKHILTDTRWLRSPYVGEVSLSVRKQMSYRASLSMQNVSSVFSTS